MTFRSTKALILIVVLTGSCGRPPSRPVLTPADQANPANAHFNTAFAAEYGGFHAALFVGDTGYAAYGTARDIDGHSDKVLVFVFYSPPLPGHPLMQVQILSPSKDGLPHHIDPWVICSLNEAQTNSVMSNGVPQSLVDALTRTADEAGWDPEHARRVNCRVIEVDASMHFEDR